LAQFFRQYEAVFAWFLRVLRVDKGASRLYEIDGRTSLPPNSVDGSKLLGANMAVQDIPTAGNDRKNSETVGLAELSRTLIVAAQMVGDALILMTLSYMSLCFILYPNNSDSHINYALYIISTVFSTVIMIFGFARSEVYDVFDELNCIKLLRATLKCLVVVILLLTAFLFVLKISDSVSRLWLATWSVSSGVALCGFRLLTASAAQRLRQTGRLTKNVAIVGASEVGQELSTRFLQEGQGTRLVGIFDERRSRFPTSGSRNVNVRQLPALYESLCKGEVDEIVIAIPPHASTRILELSRRFHPFAVSLRVLAPEGYEHFQVMDSRRYGDIGTFRVMGRPLNEVATFVKRVEDLVIAAGCLIFTLPLLVAIALAIKLDSRGPVIFRQKRLGANNLPFDVLKFRSMYAEQTDPLGHQLTRTDDPRITRVGRFLRMTSLDELPQLINVLKGEMSLVGPRPHALAASAAGIAYALAISEYPIRHRVRPGITGWAQVNGWRGETRTIEQIRRRVEHDLYYVENWSLTFDLFILGRTIIAVLSRANAV
jgi:Undecaprenyl-phosphate glucose phosphotransferase